MSKNAEPVYCIYFCRGSFFCRFDLTRLLNSIEVYPVVPEKLAGGEQWGRVVHEKDAMSIVAKETHGK